MAVENLYNTAVEYHSPLASRTPATPPQTWPFPVRPSHLNTSHSTAASASWAHKGTTRAGALRLETPGCAVVVLVVVVVVVAVMDSGSCLRLCVMLPLCTHSHPCNGARGHIL